MHPRSLSAKAGNDGDAKPLCVMKKEKIDIKKEYRINEQELRFNQERNLRKVWTFHF